MLELHIANKNYSSWSLRPWFLMQALNIPFVEQVHYFGDPNGFAQVSPNSKVPVLKDGDCLIWDTMAITEYLAESFPHVWPIEKKCRAWARSACAEMHSSFQVLRRDCSMNIGVRVKLNDVTQTLKSDIQRIENIWAEGLARFGGPWLAGEAFTAVDAFFGPIAFRFQTYGIEPSASSERYVNQLLSHSAMRQWEQEALLEKARDIPHDLEIKRVGVILQDLRNCLAK